MSKYVTFDFSASTTEVTMSTIQKMYCSDLRKYLKIKKVESEYQQFLKNSEKKDNRDSIVSFLTLRYQKVGTDVLTSDLSEININSNPIEEKNLFSFFKHTVNLNKKEINIKRHDLNISKTSWIDVFLLPEHLIPKKEEMDQLWSLHPEEKGKVKIMGNVIETPRWQQSYGRSYRFSGMNHEALPIPELVKKYLDYANTLGYTKPFRFEFNMALLNWYENGSMYIGPHSDDESEMEKTSKGETVVFSISLGQERDFKLIPKEEKDVALKIPMPHGTVVVMGGTCQKTHKHAVPKVTGKKAEGMKPRINITFRIFRNF
jgi:alkylated DNA repair dioxygenase AlkB